jgi:heterodisulfide reductase subunit B
LKEKDMSKGMCDRISQSAEGFGADCLVTACPLCKYNLNKSGKLPVIYFTELLAEALGVKEDAV